MLTLNYKDLKTTASGYGLNVLGTASIEPAVQERVFLKKWQESGFAGEMEYMKRSPFLLSDPRRLLTGARSVVSFAVAYSSGKREVLPAGYGRVARYAWGRDYHKVLKKRIERCVGEVKTRLGAPISYRIFSDSVPLLERAFAARSGLGFVGKNTMLITPGAGSFYFVAEVIWDLEVVEVERCPTLEGSCGSCSRCMDRCPTSAITAPYTVDAARCISYLTIEKKGRFSDQEKSSPGEWLFGCDLCQEVCPFNYNALKSGREPDLEEFSKDNGVGGFVNLAGILSIREGREFYGRFAGTPFVRPGREGILRNAACVAGNTLSEETGSALIESACSDNSAVVRETSLWALGKIWEISSGGAARRIKLAVEKGLKDLDNCCVEQSRRIAETIF